MTVAWISAGCIFGGALLGMALSRFLPATHLDADSRDAIRLGAVMISLRISASSLAEPPGRPSREIVRAKRSVSRVLHV
jgi:hypothetical protein